MICLDTSFILDLLKEKTDCVNKFNSIKNEEFASTEINYFEILYGVFKRKELSKKELETVQEFFNSIKVFPLDNRSSYKAAEIAGELSKKGQIIETNDTLIAGISITNNCKLITKDIKHFSKIKELKAETY